MRLFKKALCTLLTVSMVATMFVGCGKKNDESPKGDVVTNHQESPNGEEQENEVKKPEKIKVLVDGTLWTKANGQDEFVKRWEELSGIKLEIIQPDHTGYYDIVSQTFASGELPDVVLLSSTYYASYAAEGALWDMTEAWEKSELKASGTFNESDSRVIDSLYLNGKLYGFARARGNGCVTYVKKKWLENVGMEAPTNYEEYLAMLEAFTTLDPDGNGVNGDTYGVSAAGLIGNEPPYTNYLPEFYQDANPTFYKNEQGQWVDGFTEEAMVKALERLRNAYKLGYIDKESLTNATSDCRNKFFEDKFGVFTYWAGYWATRLQNSLISNGKDGELIALEPIAEVGSYVDRAATSWSITSACENPEGVYKYFIETMFDGGDIQELWLYGVEGFHWSKKAETIMDVEFEEGVIHGLESKENPGTVYTYCSLGYLGIPNTFWDTHNEYNPVEMSESQLMFNANSIPEDRSFSTEEMSQYNGDLMTLKREIIANVVVQGASIEDEMKRFEAEGGLEWSNKIVESLNNVN